MAFEPAYVPDFDIECRICGTLPTVVVVGHSQPQSELCGVHFFSDQMMFDWDLWNDAQEPTE
jgi:hypothetical protein